MLFDGYKVETDATSEPVTAAELRTWLRLDDTSQDTMLDSMIKAARISIEQHTHRSLVEKTIKQSLADFPANECIELLFPPLSSVGSVSYWNSDGTEVTIDSSNYIVNTNRIVGLIEPVDNYTWPSVYDRQDAVNVTYTTDGDACPESAKVLIRLMAADMYEHSEMQSELRLTDNKLYKILLDSLSLKDFY